MNNGISICPAIRRLELRHVGVWRRLSLEFSPGLNIVTGPGGSGKTTIIASALACLDPLRGPPLRLSASCGQKRGSSRVEFMYPGWRRHSESA